MIIDMILYLNVGELVPAYSKWGLSQNHVRFSRDNSLENSYSVHAAILRFVKDFHATPRELDALNFSTLLFPIQPKNKPGAGRAVPVVQVTSRHPESGDRGR